MQAYWRLLSYLRPHRPVIALTWLISVLVLGLQGMTAWIGAGFIERILRSNDAPPSLLQGVGEIALLLTRAADSLLTRSTPFASLVICGVAAHLTGRRVHYLSRRLMERIASLQGFLTEYLTTVLLARSLGRETVERKRFDELCGQLARADIELTVMDSLAPQLVNTLFVSAGAVVVLCGGYSVLVSSSMNSGVLLRFVLCLPMASYPVEALSLLYVSSRRAAASAARVFGLLDQPPVAADRPEAIEPPRSITGIEFQEVGFQPAGRSVLDGLSFRLQAGERVLISGPSGAGKTTVLHFLAGVIRPDAGRVMVNGLELAAFRGEPWRQKIGIVPQEPLMMNGTVRDNLRFACESADDAKMVEVLKRVLFEPDEQFCRLALDRPVGNRGEMLSGGERQRLAIGRALLNDPALLLLDEPVAHLDPVSRVHVKETLLALPRNVTVVFTSHDRTLHDLADLEIALQDGHAVSSQPT